MKCLWVVAFLSVFPGSALGGAPSAESLLEGDGGHPVVGQQPRPFHLRIETEFWTWRPGWFGRFKMEL